MVSKWRLFLLLLLSLYLLLLPPSPPPLLLLDALFLFGLLKVVVVLVGFDLQTVETKNEQRHFQQVENEEGGRERGREREKEEATGLDYFFFA